MLACVERADRRLYDLARQRAGARGLPFELRFHFHPEADVALDMGGAAVSVALRSGEIWVFRPEGRLHMALEPSVYLERDRLKPRAAKQVVLTAAAFDYATRIRWTLAKAVETPSALRDLAPGASVDAD